jgi:LacI family transcriptional regulator, galactose operon repressor
MAPAAACRSPPAERTLATMMDVAKRAGVSVTTVSHVLNKTRKVSPDTVRAVEEAIAAVGFAPNTLARALVRSSTNTIGVALSAITNIYFGEVVRGVQSACAENGFIIFLSDTEDDPAKQIDVVRELHQRRVDGIVLAPVPDPEGRVLRYIETHRIPVVFVDRSFSGRFDQVLTENRKPMRDLVAHLAGHGHRRIGLISGLDGLSTTRERIEGYQAGLSAAGLAFDAALIATGASDIIPAHDSVLALLARPDPPTAIITANNKMTIGAVKALRESGRRVPDDVALAGFDDFEWADSFDPRLTLIAQPCAELGRRAVSLLLRRIQAPERKPQTVRLSPVLKIRNSCGCH